MKRMAFFMLMGCLFVMTGNAPAQEPKIQLNVVEHCIVYPSMEMQFREGMKEEIALCRKHHFPYAWKTISTEDGNYHFIMPVEDYNDIGNMLEAAEEFYGREDTGLMRSTFKGTYDSYRMGVYAFSPDLSYKPENPAPTGDNFRYVAWDICYVIPGMESDFEAMVKEAMSLMRQNNTTQAWYGHVGGLGTDQPVYIFASMAKNAVDFNTRNAAMWEAFGDRGSEIYRRMLECLRKREQRRGWFQPGLSYTPENK